MSEFKFEITFKSHQLEGDEFWEDALKEDGTGIKTLTDFLEDMLTDSNILVGSDTDPKDVVKLTSYTKD